MSFLLRWRTRTIDYLSTHVGAVAEFVVDDAADRLGNLDGTVSATKYLRFLHVLYEELPVEVDRQTICASLRGLMLKDYGFPSKDDDV